MDSDSFVSSIKREDVYKDIAKDGETEFGTSNYIVEKPLPKGNKVIKIIAI